MLSPQRPGLRFRRLLSTATLRDTISTHETGRCTPDNDCFLGHSDVAGTFARLLRQHASPRTLCRLRHVHCNITILGLEKHRPLERLLLHAYGKYGSEVEAWTLFDHMSEPDSASWNFIIAVYAKRGDEAKAFSLFMQMQLEGYLLDQHLFATILSACCSEVGLKPGKLLHARIAASGLESDLVIATALVNMYGKCHSLEHVQMVLADMQGHDVVSWNAIISVYVQNCKDEIALQLYDTMLMKGILPNEITFSCTLSACNSEAGLIKGLQIHAQVIAFGIGMNVNVFVATSLVILHGKCSRTSDARQLFDVALKEDLILWNAMIAVYAQNGQGKDALEVFEQMMKIGIKPGKTAFVSALEACVVMAEGQNVHSYIKLYGYESDNMVGASLVDMYGKCSRLEEAHAAFDRLIDRNPAAWNAIIASYAHAAAGREVFQLFEQMFCEAVIPDGVTHLSVVSLCASHATYAECKRVQCRIINNELDSDANLRVGVISMYGKHGRLEAALEVFNMLPTPDVSLWTALIGAFNQSGRYADALAFFQQMLLEGVLVDKVAFVSVVNVLTNQEFLCEGVHMHVRIANCGFASETDVLNALFMLYGKHGKLQDARLVFWNMQERDTISYNAMLMLLLEADQGLEAIPLFQQMLYEGLMPDSVTLKSILNTCSRYGTLSTGSRIHACFFHANSFYKGDDVVGTALLSMYASCGCLESAWRIFEAQGEKDTSTWMAIMEAFAIYGKAETTTFLFCQLQEEMLMPNRGITIKLLSAYGHTGLVSEACHAFHILSRDLWEVLIVDHFNCLVDLFGRIGLVKEAEALINRMPILPVTSTWSTLLGACRLVNDVKRGEFAVSCIWELDLEDSASYTSLSNIYTAAGNYEVAVSRNHN